MLITESALYCYCRDGRYGAQIPTVTLNLGGGPECAETWDIVDIPDDWVYRTDCSGLPTKSTNSFLHWSRKGFTENEARLRAEFKTSKGFRTGERYDYGLSFENWRTLCEQDWDRVDKAVAKKITSMKSKLALYESYQSDNDIS